eukprot:Gb_20802 [translate_table: standard]
MGHCEAIVNGGASGIQPVDMIKVRIQLSQGSGYKVVKNMLCEEGMGAFYKGAIGASVGSPAVLVLIRMQADATCLCSATPLQKMLSAHYIFIFCNASLLHVPFTLYA